MTTREERIIFVGGEILNGGFPASVLATRIVDALFPPQRKRVSVPWLKEGEYITYDGKRWHYTRLNEIPFASHTLLYVIDDVAYRNNIENSDLPELITACLALRDNPWEEHGSATRR